jgi:hypothetical protein
MDKISSITEINLNYDISVIDSRIKQSIKRRTYEEELIIKLNLQKAKIINKLKELIA